MNKRRMYHAWQRFRHSIWYPAILGLIPSFVVSFAFMYGQRESIWGFVANFVATEGLVVLVLIVAKPVLEAQRIVDKPGHLEINKPDEKILISRLKAAIPTGQNFDAWDQHYQKLRDSWLDLIKTAEKNLCAEDLSLEQMRSVEGVFQIAAAQVRAGTPMNIYTLKRASCYLNKDSARDITQVLVINRIKSALWFTPGMSIYGLDIYRHIIEHPNKPKLKRITIVDAEEMDRIKNQTWRMSDELDPLKAFIAMNQICSYDIHVLSEVSFSKAVEDFLKINRTRIKGMCSLDEESEKEFIRDVAFIMYCKGIQPVKAFRGRPYRLPNCSDENQQGTIDFLDINGDEECKLHYDLFQHLLKHTFPIPRVSLANDER